MESALYIAILIITVMLIVLVLTQSKGGGLAQNDASSIYRTKRGLEKTLHHTTIVLAVIFLLLSLIASLPIFPSSVTPVLPPT